MEQYIGDGASLFITIIACLAAFGAGMSAIDMGRTKKQNKINEANNPKSK